MLFCCCCFPSALKYLSFPHPLCRRDYEDLVNLDLTDLKEPTTYTQSKFVMGLRHWSVIVRFFCLSVCLSVCLSFCMSVYLSFCPSLCLSVPLLHPLTCLPSRTAPTCSSFVLWQNIRGAAFWSWKTTNTRTPIATWRTNVHFIERTNIHFINSLKEQTFISLTHWKNKHSFH